MVVLLARLTCYSYLSSSIPVFPHWTTGFQDIVTRLLVKDPKKRITLDKVLVHKWVSGTAPRTHLPATVKALLKMRAKARFRVGPLLLPSMFRLHAIGCAIVMTGHCVCPCGWVLPWPSQELGTAGTRYFL